MRDETSHIVLVVTLALRVLAGIAGFGFTAHQLLRAEPALVEEPRP